MLKILGFGDTHISERIVLVGGNTRDERGERRSLRDARRYFAWLAEEATREKVSVIVSAGDLFDRARPTPAEYGVAIDGLRKLAAIAPLAMIAGNHDLPSGLDADALRPIRLARIPGLRIIEGIGDSETILDESGAKLRIWGLPYPPPLASTGEGREADNAQASRALAAQLATMASEAAQLREAGGPLSLLLAHVTFSGGRYLYDQAAPAHDLQAPTGDLAAFDLVVAGHLHQRQQIGGLHHAYYTGTGDRWSFSQEEEGAGAVIFELHEEEEPGYKLRATRWLDFDARSFRTYKPHDLRLSMPFAGAFVRAVGEVSDPREYDEIVAKLREWQAAGGYARCDVTLNREAGALAAVETGASLDALFEAYLLARPEAIPEDLRAAALARARQILAETEA